MVGSLACRPSDRQHTICLNLERRGKGDVDEEIDGRGGTERKSKKEVERSRVELGGPLFLYTCSLRKFRVFSHASAVSSGA